MSYKYLLLILILFSSIVSIAQDEKTKIDSLCTLPYTLIVSEPKKMIKILKDGIVTSEKIGYKYGTAKLFSNLALAYSSLSEYDNYREAGIKAIKLFEEMNNETELASEYALYGYHLRRTNIEQSRRYMQLAIKLGEKNNLIENLAATYDNYGVVLEKLNELDSALYFYKKGLTLKYSLSDSIGIPYSLNHLAGIYAVRGKMDKAFEYMTLSDEYRNKAKNKYGRAENAVIFGELYSLDEKYDLAIKKFNESLAIAKEIGNKNLVQYNYEKLANISKIRDDYETAFYNLMNHNKYKDSVYNLETNKKIAELEIKFESEKKDKEISESKLKLNEQHKQIAFILILLFFLFVVSIAIYWFQKYKRKLIRNELELKNRLARVEFENKISDEKMRISRELHDNIGSQLTFLVSSIDNITYDSGNEKQISKLNKLSGFGRNTLTELRQTIWAMKNDESTLQQFLVKLNELIKQILSNTKITVVNNVTSEIHLSSIQTLNLFRVVQEAIQNTVKHANAKMIEILFDDSENGIQLSIKDDGSGFDLSSAQMGNGIENMKFRCEEAGGVFSILSSEKGTEVICNIHLK